MDSIMIKEKLSTSGITFEDMTKKAIEIDNDRTDYIVKDVAKNFWMNDDGTITIRAFGDKGLEEVTMAISPWALRQLSVRLNMPSGYASLCIERHHADLAAENINTWLTEQNGNKRKNTTDFLVRTYKGEIDAVLSYPGYTAFDTPKILNVVENALNLDDYSLVGSYLSNERLHLRLISKEMLHVDGEDLYPALFINSSDVARASLDIKFGIYKKVCTNGLCINKIGGVLYHQRHMGITELDVETEMLKRLHDIPALICKSEEIIKAARNEKIDLGDQETFNHMVHEIRQAAKMSEEEAHKTLAIAQEKYSMTRWGVVNAMTEFAQTFELDERIRIEEAAGQLIHA